MEQQDNDGGEEDNVMNHYRNKESIAGQSILEEPLNGSRNREKYDAYCDQQLVFSLPGIEVFRSPGSPQSGILEPGRRCIVIDGGIAQDYHSQEHRRDAVGDARPATFRERREAGREENKARDQKNEEGQGYGPMEYAPTPV